MSGKNNKKPIVTIVGRPNVGKSSLFNRIIGQRTAITSDVAGTTRDRIYEDVEWKNTSFMLVDTAGIDKDIEGELAENIQDQINFALDEADFFIFMVEAGTEITIEDEKAAQILRKKKKPYILVANKADNQELENSIVNFYKLGLGEPIGVSSIHGRGVGDFLDLLVQKIKKIPGKPIEPKTTDIVVALLGRPNVGKSSILNKLSGQGIAIVSEVPGTTRDVNEAIIKKDDKKILLIDTAGIRKSGKIETGIEKYSVLRSLKAAERADIVLLVLDATEGAVAKDLSIAGMVKEMGKGLIIVVNKWDAIEKDEQPMDQYLAMLRDKYDFVSWSPVIFVSALTGKNLDKIGSLIESVSENREIKIQTSKVNNLIEKITTKRPPGIKRGTRPKIFYATQTGTAPPEFTLFCNYPEYIHFSYIRYLENSFRKEADFTGTPIKIVLKKRQSK
ncbi:MAG: GTPase Der [candidate division CPR2 bacterium GW2011_GWC1_39_9]|uniref:GTPase Der n=1 Tax=candidate division CPR2 bacterium GW2011_GWC2_39_10 TaxID=1618345 RepID=A0A0G0LUW0_UNCC2|nr:MAG: GTPase Der [candidate division CPR2 bacterium GW2011_GWC2_39_10]KKR34577.1 MAG: GTPase Der [candidate division CPR2 bacterium GW2011_GWC1_39_9]